jgi:hypothetical protein
MNDSPAALDLGKDDGLRHTMAHKELAALRAETPPVGQQIDGFEHAGLAGPIRALEHVDARTSSDSGLGNIAPVLEAQLNQFHARVA